MSSIRNRLRLVRVLRFIGLAFVARWLLRRWTQQIIDRDGARVVLGRILKGLGDAKGNDLS